MFTHLHTHSSFSFQRGTIAATALPAIAKAHGMTSLALTDTNNVCGAMEFYSTCKREGIKPIIGVELNTRTERAVLLAKNAEGYRTICQTVTDLHSSIPQVKPKLTFEDALTDPLPTPDLSAVQLHSLLMELGDDVIILSSSPKTLRKLAPLYPGNIYIELINAERRGWNGLREVYEQYKIPFVATQNVYFETAQDYELHRLMRAIGTNTTLGTLPRREIAHPSQYFLSEAQMRAQLSKVSNDAFINVEKIAEQCNVEFDLSYWKFAQHEDPEPFKRLRSLAAEGFAERYPKPQALHLTRFEYELEIIEKMNATSYYLAVKDMIEYAKRKNYPFLGRGSGANSMIAYCIGISNIDPIENGLPFERFLNPERESFPDFDIDFPWNDRYDVIHYMMDRYGKERCAMLCTIQSYRDRGAIREIGKAYGYSDAEIRMRMATIRSDHYTGEAKKLDRKQLLAKYPQDVQEWMFYAYRLQGVPRHLSVHAGGLLIADRAITHYTAIQQAPVGVPITQQDMFSADDWKLVKLDILSTRGLGTYRDTLNLVEQRHGERPKVEIDPTIAFKDEKTKEIIRTGKSRGCFYIESPAMIGLLRKLQCDTFKGLTAASSVIRPGVAQSGMMQEYIRRHHDPSARKHLHPSLGELMAETYGIMIYQEDVLAVVHEVAGLSYGEADLFRRAMSGKLRSHERMSQMREKFITGCASKGIGEDIAAEIWRQISSFAGYSFCKAHSASYAVLSFQEAWLKVYYPAEFLCSVLNNQGGFYNHQEYVNEAKFMGIRVLLPDVNKSEYNYTVEGTGNDAAIRVGLLAVRDLSQSSLESLLANREQAPYRSVEDFGKRSGVQAEEGRALIAVGACDSFGLPRPELMIRYSAMSTSVKRTGKQAALDFDERLGFDLSRYGEYSAIRQFLKEREILGLAVTDYPVRYLEHAREGCVTSDQLEKHIGREVTFVGHIVAQKPVSTRKGESMLMLNLGDDRGVVDVVIWPSIFKKYYKALVATAALKIQGRVSESFGVASIEAREIEAVAFDQIEKGRDLGRVERRKEKRLERDKDRAPKSFRSFM
jgi:DNA-directed DNA polymerase III PolC